MKACPSCEAYVRAGDHVCPHCGASMCTGPCFPKKTAAALLLGLAAGCNGFVGQPKYGVADTGSFDSAADADGDGYTVDEGDCDDHDADVNPGEDELTGDAVDSNCDGDPDT